MTPSPFVFTAPAWANDPKGDLTAQQALDRARELASVYYPLGVKTGIHSMIEWCGVMTEYVKMLEVAAEAGHDPREVDQHHGTPVSVPDFMIAYFCEKLGCQLKPFIAADTTLWRQAIEQWFPKRLTPPAKTVQAVDKALPTLQLFNDLLRYVGAFNGLQEERRSYTLTMCSGAEDEKSRYIFYDLFEQCIAKFFTVYGQSKVRAAVSGICARHVQHMHEGRRAPGGEHASVLKALEHIQSGKQPGRWPKRKAHAEQKTAWPTEKAT